MIEISIEGTKATLTGGVWSGSNGPLAELCATIGKSRPRSSYEPDPEHAEATHVCERLNGSIVSDVPDIEEETPSEAVY
jgi:hypothetical protein